MTANSSTGNFSASLAVPPLASLGNFVASSSVASSSVASSSVASSSVASSSVACSSAASSPCCIQLCCIHLCCIQLCCIQLCCFQLLPSTSTNPTMHAVYSGELPPQPQSYQAFKHLESIKMPVFSGDKGSYGTWKAAFAVCIDNMPGLGSRFWKYVVAPVVCFFICLLTVLPLL